MEVTQSSVGVDELEVVAKEIVSSLLGYLGIEASVDVEIDKGEQLVKGQIEPAVPGILIGRHGETLMALQYLAGLILRSRLGWQSGEDGYHVVLNVGDWRLRREETVKALAVSASERAKSTGEPQTLYDLFPSERRLVHVLLSGDSEVTTESEGEGRDRRLVVKPRS